MYIQLRVLAEAVKSIVFSYSVTPYEGCIFTQSGEFQVIFIPLVEACRELLSPMRGDTKAAGQAEQRHKWRRQMTSSLSQVGVSLNV